MSNYDPTRPFKPSEADPVSDWEEDEPSPKLLWGRVLALAAVLLLAFLLGRASAPDDSADEAENLRARLAQANAQIKDLEEEVKFGAAPTPTETPAETPGPDDTDDGTQPAGGGFGGPGRDEDDNEGDEEVETYTVKEGDTLNSIAQEFFDDPSAGTCIADANDIDPTQLTVGTEIQIPPGCGD